MSGEGGGEEEKGEKREGEKKGRRKKGKERKYRASRGKPPQWRLNGETAAICVDPCEMGRGRTSKTGAREKKGSKMTSRKKGQMVVTRVGGRMEHGGWVVVWSKRGGWSYGAWRVRAACRIRVGGHAILG